MSEIAKSHKATKPAKKPAHQTETDEQIARLREMLELMASSSRAIALGAAHDAVAETDKRVRVPRL